MEQIYYLTPKLRKQLKKPLGILIQGSLEDTIKLLRELVKKDAPPKIVTVGDQVSKDLTAYSLLPDIMIVDNRIMRQKIPPIDVKADITIHVQNPAGTITDEAWSAIEEATKKSERTKIIVQGEEDLLTLAVILNVPENSLVLYGQPRKGLVAVRATLNMKKRTQKILDEMKDN